MDPAALAAMVAADRAAGDHPFCVVAQLGSVNVGAVDPLDALADVCAEHGLWLHGDGACGLFGAGTPEMAARFAGLARADSLSVDGHKWLGVPYDCGVLLVRDPESLRRAFSIEAPYLRGAHDDAALDFMDQGPEMSRGFRALKLWMTLRAYGTAGLRAGFARSVSLARHLHELVLDHPDFVVLHEPVLYIYSFRCVPLPLADRADEPAVAEHLDQLNQAIADRVTRSGLALVMTTRIHGRVSLRLSIGSQRTRRRDVDRTFEALAEAAREIARATAFEKEIPC